MRNMLFLIFALFYFSSCTKVLDIDLNDAEPNISIEAPLLEGTHDFEVIITQTSNYFGTEQPTPIVNALVTLKQGEGTAIEVPHIVNGKYQLADYTAIANQRYTLEVTVNGITYAASSFMPTAVPLESLEFEEAQQPPFGAPEETEYTVFIKYLDPAMLGDHYRVKTVVNNVPTPEGDDLFVIEDRLSNGTSIRYPLFNNNYKAGDVVEVQFLSIDEPSFKYFNTLSSLIGADGGPGGGASASPANPTTNWTGGALGYFSASSQVSKTITITP